jgi:hypothetical protein
LLRRLAALLLLALEACSTGANVERPRASEWTLPCNSDVSDEFHVERKQAISEAVRVGSRAIGKDPSTSLPPFPSVAVRTACNGLAKLQRPFCVEGAGAQYGDLAAKASAAGQDITDAIAGLERAVEIVDRELTPIACRGFGMGFGDAGSAALNTIASQLSERCALHALDGFSYRAVNRANTPTPNCKQSANRDAGCLQAQDQRLAALNIEQLCTGEHRAWCGYGVGRSLGNAYPGQFDRAARFCRGSLRGACLAGVGFVAVFLYPERIEGALRVAAHLDVNDQLAYFDGIGNGIAWRARTDAAELGNWLAAAPDDAKALALHVEEQARHCGHLDFASGKNCTWPQVRRCPN